MLEHLKSIYWQMIIILVILAILGAGDIQSTLPQVMIAVVVAAAIDFPIKFYKKKKIAFPKSAVITGLLIGEILAPSQPWYVPAAAAAIAILSKHLIRIYGRKVFNPANLALTLVSLAGLTWWGATNIYAVAILGLFIVYRIRAWKMVAVFLAVYLFTISLASSIRGLPVSINILLDGSVLYFAFLMLTEHKTYPMTEKGRIVFGALAAAFAGALQATGLFSYITIGLVIADMFVPWLNKMIVIRSS